MFELIYHWVDLLWLPVVFFTVHKRHRWWALGFVTVCIITMHLEVEIIESTSYNFGIIGLVHLKAQTRGLIVYSFFYILLLVLAHFSPRTQGIVFMATCLGIYFMAFSTSMVFMLL